MHRWSIILDINLVVGTTRYYDVLLIVWMSMRWIHHPTTIIWWEDVNETKSTRRVSLVARPRSSSSCTVGWTRLWQITSPRFFLGRLLNIYASRSTRGCYQTIYHTVWVSLIDVAPHNNQIRIEEKERQIFSQRTPYFKCYFWT